MSSFASGEKAWLLPDFICAYVRTLTQCAFEILRKVSFPVSKDSCFSKLGIETDGRVVRLLFTSVCHLNIQEEWSKRWSWETLELRKQSF
jgi:hypothetical protein